jgi:hypothetical protein
VVLLENLSSHLPALLGPVTPPALVPAMAQLLQCPHEGLQESSQCTAQAALAARVLLSCGGLSSPQLRMLSL